MPCVRNESSRHGIQAATCSSCAIKNIKLDCGYRIDVLVDNRIIIELKSVDKLLPIHKAQLLTYMKLAGISIGLLINFNVNYLKDGIKRMVL